MSFQNDDEDDLWDRVNDMADRMGLSGDKRQVYVHDHMTQGGYQQVQSRESYTRAAPEGEEGQGDGNRWGFGSRGRRNTGTGRNSGGGRDDRDDSF